MNISRFRQHICFQCIFFCVFCVFYPLYVLYYILFQLCLDMRCMQIYICTEEQYELSRDFTGNFLFCCCFLVQTCLLLFPCYIDSILWKVKSLKWSLIIVKDLIWRKSREMYLIIYTQTDYNIFCLQDAHFVEQDEVQIKNQWQGECILIHLHLTREVLLYFFQK